MQSNAGKASKMYYFCLMNDTMTFKTRLHKMKNSVFLSPKQQSFYLKFENAMVVGHQKTQDFFKFITCNYKNCKFHTYADVSAEEGKGQALWVP